MEKKFWLIRTDMPYFLIGLSKLPISVSHRDYLLNNNNILTSYQGKKHYKIYISNRDFSWNTVAQSGYDDYVESGHEYMGEVIVTQDDIDNYELNTSMNKYNL